MNIQEKNKKGIIYYRVSTEDQAQNGISLEQQKRACLDYGERNDIEIVEIYHDDGVSAKTTERKDLQNMLNFCRKNHKKIDYAIVYKIDRLSRNLNDYTNIHYLLKKLGITLISTSEAIDETPIGKFMGNFLAANAQLDNELKGERVSACMMAKVKNGIWVWKAPFGYKNVRDENDRAGIAVDEERKPFIKYIFEEYAKGVHTLEEIRQKVNKKGFKTWKGKELSMQSMSKIIVEKFYIGTMTVKGREYEGKHDTFVKESTFLKCQKRLRKTNRHESATLARKNEHFPLRNFVVCAHCGRPLTGSLSTGKLGKKYPYYRCYNPKCGDRKSIAKRIIEEQFLQYIQDITPKQEYLNAFKAVVLDTWETKTNDKTKHRKIAKKKINKLEEEKKGLIKMKQKELLDDEDYKNSYNEIKEKIARENETLDNSDDYSQKDFKRAVEFVFGFIERLPEEWDEAKIDRKQKIQGLIFKTKPIYNYSTFGTPQISSLLAQNKEPAYADSSVVARRGVEPLLHG